MGVMKLLFLLLTFSASTAVASPHAPLTSRAEAPNLGYQELYSLQKEFYEKFRYPNNVKEAESINSTVFSEDVQGRVSDTRTFSGRELNTEYIFGLFIPNTNSTSIIGQPLDYEIIQFTANQNIASATTRVQFVFPSFGNKTLPVAIDTWITWNEAREITQYDVTFRWFGFLLDTLVKSLDSDATKAREKAAQAIAGSICDAHESHCKGGNQQYESRDECMEYLTKNTRLGQSFELGMDTLMCRSVHEIMIKFRPDVHCSHVGKDGGGMCDDKYSYVEKVEEDFFRNSPWIPTVF
ncbi:hypothetical protein K469DRAFT_663487 [Zopfia rhizophila CBS 207.26]|uniref:Uncharacterized protein n=1 Tax=Zopfia rhizophila CBS 207.26 TaxID=1314779 RepID=A0A6A6E3N4_9PEZI|nr:hypothetical protein K469DRAFT_663487 [Zopfia rhizophila CBS 207.26]